MADAVSPLGKVLLRATAIVLSLIPLGLWFLWFMIPVDPIRPNPAEKGSALWFLYPIELLLIGTANWMYMHSLQGKTESPELPVHAQLFRMFVVALVSLTTVFLLVLVAEIVFRGR